MVLTFDKLNFELRRFEFRASDGHPAPHPPLRGHQPPRRGTSENSFLTRIRSDGKFLPNHVLGFVNLVYKGDVTSDDGKKHLAAVGYYISLQIRALLIISNCDVPDGWRPVVTAVPERPATSDAVWLATRRGSTSL